MQKTLYISYNGFHCRVAMYKLHIHIIEKNNIYIRFLNHLHRFVRSLESIPGDSGHKMGDTLDTGHNSTHTHRGQF